MGATQNNLDNVPSRSYPRPRAPLGDRLCCVPGYPFRIRPLRNLSQSANYWLSPSSCSMP
eukprot:5305854-Pyramimonas_sp.AAC.1